MACMLIPVYFFFNFRELEIVMEILIFLCIMLLLGYKKSVPHSNKRIKELKLS